MIVLLADVNIQGHIEIVIKRMQAEPCIGFWNFLEMSGVSFPDLGLDACDSDAVIWALLEYLLEIENLLGTGRLFLPGKD